MNEEPMTKKAKNSFRDDLRPEYDLKTLLKGAVRGKYVRQYQEGTNLVLLEPDVAKAFTNASAVNAALRLVIQLKGLPNGRIPKRATAR